AGRSCCTTSRPPHDAAARRIPLRALTSAATQNEERARLEASVKASDGFFTTFFVSPYSKYIARWAARRGLTPNQVTLTSAAVGALAAAAFATGHRPGLVVGAILLQAAFTLDCVDGQLARYTRAFSRFGAWLDSIFDRTKEYLVYAGLAIGACRAVRCGRCRHERGDRLRALRARRALARAGALPRRRGPRRRRGRGGGAPGRAARDRAAARRARGPLRRDRSDGPGGAAGRRG